MGVEKDVGTSQQGVEFISNENVPSFQSKAAKELKDGDVVLYRGELVRVSGLERTGGRTSFVLVNELEKISGVLNVKDALLVLNVRVTN